MTLTPDDVRDRVATNVKAARVAAGLTLEELGEHIGPTITRRHVWRWEKAYVLPSNEHLIAIASATGYEFGWFYADHSNGNGNGAK